MEILSRTYLSLFNCVLWAGVAQNTTEYCKKGDLLGVKGRVQSRIVEKEDKTQYLTEMIAEKVTFLSNKHHEECENKNEDEE